MRRPPRSERSSPLIRPAPEVPPEAGVVLRAGLVEAGPRDADERRAALRIWLRRLMTQLRCWWWASAETIRRHWNRLGRLVRAPRRQTWVSGLGSGWQAKPVKEVPWTAAPAHGAHSRRGPSLAGRFGRWSAKWRCCCREACSNTRAACPGCTGRGAAPGTGHRSAHRRVRDAVTGRFMSRSAPGTWVTSLDTSSTSTPAMPRSEVSVAVSSSTSTTSPRTIGLNCRPPTAGARESWPTMSISALSRLLSGK